MKQEVKKIERKETKKRGKEIEKKTGYQQLKRGYKRSRKVGTELKDWRVKQFNNDANCRDS